MRFIQALVWRVVCVGMLILGVLAFYWDLTAFHTALITHLPDSAPLRWFLGGLLIALALIGLIPWPKRTRDRRKIAFKGAHGNVSIQLDSVEQTLNRAARKITEAKRINARITPSDNARNVHIQADVTLRKPANASAREVEARVSAFIVEQTKRILGEETAVTADLNIVDIIIEESDKPSYSEEAAISAEASQTEALDSPSGIALEDLESEEEELLHEPPLPGASLSDTDEDEQDEEPASEEDEQAEDEDDKPSLW